MEDQEAIQRVLKGDHTAFELLVEKYQNYVFTVSYNILKKREVAEEAAQDAFLKAYKTLDTFRGDARFSTWLYTIAFRTAIDLKRKKSKPTLSINDEEQYLQIADEKRQMPSEQLDRLDLKVHLEKAISQLKGKDAAIITLFYLNERSVKEIANITGLTVTNIKTKLYRLRDHLKLILQKELDNEIKEWI